MIFRSRPKVVAFDIIETVFSLEGMRGRLTALGLPPSALEPWFAAGLRDAFALAVTNEFKPFKAVLESSLEHMLARHGIETTSERKAGVLDGMRELEPHADAAAAFQTLAEAGLRIVALSNGAAASTRSLLDRAGLDTFVEHVISVDDVKLSKPRGEVYLHAARVAEVEAGEVALAATHAWDVHGAKSAGLLGVFIARGQPFPSTMRAPDISGESLQDAAAKLAVL